MPKTRGGLSASPSSPTPRPHQSTMGGAASPPVQDPAIPPSEGEPLLSADTPPGGHPLNLCHLSTKLRGLLLDPLRREPSSRVPREPSHAPQTTDRGPTSIAEIDHFTPKSTFDIEALRQQPELRDSFRLLQSNPRMRRVIWNPWQSNEELKFKKNQALELHSPLPKSFKCYGIPPEATRYMPQAGTLRTSRWKPISQPCEFNLLLRKYFAALLGVCEISQTPFSPAKCQTFSKDFSSEDERLGSLSLGVRKAGDLQPWRCTSLPLASLWEVTEGRIFWNCQHLVINFVDYSLNQGAPAGHESAETPFGHESNALLPGIEPRIRWCHCTAAARDESGAIGARHITEALRIPYEPVIQADFREWSSFSQSDMGAPVVPAPPELPRDEQLPQAQQDEILIDTTPPAPAAHTSVHMPEAIPPTSLLTQGSPPVMPTTPALPPSSEPVVTVSLTEFRA
ncbi:hypothetical protein CK203_066287 [Vitis vinifera]|uniref:Uncharacterized protein n=1 Tax=Vitis vinifera TaxID=29760 RepID=A0A438G3L9_VITVI|nr:hypothetical protein CK203_066287 [Vitis vinifera]